MNESNITMIDVGKLLPHPNNPRKDVGDLTELAESIKAQGVLQNLTVVHTPGKDAGGEGVCTTCVFRLADDSCFKYQVSGGKNCDGWKPSEKYAAGSSDVYTVIIGHRRLAAAKLAGLVKVPCVVAEMDEKTQLATMLLENIQRADLTAYEQAQGFQLMMDLGESVKSISDVTGFSESTVRRRVKLLELNGEEFKASVSRGATLMDFDELNKVSDLDKRNELLQYMGTDNYKWELRKALNDEKRDANKIRILEVLNTYAQNITKEQARDLNYVTYINCSSSDYEPPEDAGKTNYYYLDSGIGFDLYTDKAPEESVRDAEEIAKEAEEKRKRQKVADLYKMAYLNRVMFMQNLTAQNAEYAKPYILRKACEYLADGHTLLFSGETYCFVTGIKASEVKLTYRDSDELKTVGELVRERLDAASGGKEVAKTLAVCVYCMLDSNITNLKDVYFSTVYRKDKELEAVYEYLINLGYAVSDEERALLDGSHEVYFR